MLGRVIDYRETERTGMLVGRGVVEGFDGSMYQFLKPDWLDSADPQPDLRVRFFPSHGSARNIYVANPDEVPRRQKIRKAPSILWAVFLGGFGAHKYYQGSWAWGIIYSITFWLYIPFVLAIVEWVRYVLMSDEEFDRKAIAFARRSGGPFGFFW